MFQQSQQGQSRTETNKNAKYSHALPRRCACRALHHTSLWDNAFVQTCVCGQPRPSHPMLQKIRLVLVVVVAYFRMSHDSDCATINKNIQCSPTLSLCERNLPRPDAVWAVVINPQFRSWILHFPRGLLSPRVGGRGRLRHLGGVLHCLCYRKAGFGSRCSSSLNDEPRDLGAQT